MRLFDAVPGGGGLEAGQQRALDKIKRRDTTAAVDLVRVNKDAFAQPQISINVPRRRTYQAKRFRLSEDNGMQTWLGEINTIPQGAVFVIRGDNVTGTIRTRDALYKLSPLGGGIHALVTEDPRRLPPEHPPRRE